MCYIFKQKYNFGHLSAGDLLREELKLSSSEHRDVIKKHIDAGTIVPVEITCALLKKVVYYVYIIKIMIVLEKNSTFCIKIIMK